MDVAGGLSLVQTVIGMLDSPIWTEIGSVLGVESQLQKLKDTVSTIQNVLLDAEDQERLHHGRRSHVESGILERLKEALYKADDLFDEVTTLAHRKKLMPGSLYPSRLIHFCSAFTWSGEINKVREMLDNIVKDRQHDFGLMRNSIDFRVAPNPRETHSFVCEEDVIIGRDEDKQIVMDMLVDTSVQESVSVVSIVGIGGLGKTTLAQQVYNDERVREKFPLKMWVCISDDFNVKAVVGQILAAANPGIKQDGMSMDQLQMMLRQELEGKTYLLVLDDIWNEDASKWHELRKLLIGGEWVSRIIVTTRSKRVADVVGSHWTHELKGLSHEDSWILFQRMALKPEEYPMKAELVDVGKEIVQKCANVPLAIRVVGSLLRGQEESKWQYLKNNDLANIKQDENNGIVPVLKISYYYLPFHLKSCFRYCAVFPKDYKIIKEDLICLWMAQGFIISSDGESFEDAGEEFFKQLLQRCFFQDVEQAEGSDEIISFKMHDLIHDLATEVAGIRNLKRWWNLASESGMGETLQAAILAKLSHLHIQGCPNLIAFPYCPELKELKLYRCNDVLGSFMKETNINHKQQQEEEGLQGRLERVEIDKVGYLKSLSIHSFHHLSYLKINTDHNLEGLSTAEVFRSSHLSSLRSLDITLCNKLKSISGRGVWEHFTALESLKLESLPELELEDENDVSSSSESTGEGSNNKEGSDDAEMPWRYLAPTLRSLKLDYLRKLVKLPKGIGFLSSLQSLNIHRCNNLETLTPSIGGLSSLQSLRIDDCFNLKSVPEEMRHLTSLTQLHIRGCSPELKKRCENHNDADWSNIQHIPHVIVETKPDLNHFRRNCFGQ